MLKLRCRIKAKKLKLAHWTSYTQSLYSRCVFTAEVIPYQEHWKRITKVESYNVEMMLLYFLAYHSPRSHISKTPGFFAVILVQYNALKLCSQKFQLASISTLLLLLAACMLIHNYCILFSGFYFLVSILFMSTTEG